MFAVDLGKPFKAALVFLSHSWKDNEVADYLYGKLRDHFQVCYDRAHYLDDAFAAGFTIGDSLLARDLIARVDFFLFLASESSMEEGAISLAELQLADYVDAKFGRRVGIVQIAPYVVPVEYSNRVFETLHYRTRARDAERIVKVVSIRLARAGGLKPIAGLSSKVVYQGGQNLDLLLSLLTGRRSTGVYALNGVIQCAEVERLIRKVVDSGQVDKVAERLLEIYLFCDSPEHTVARENAVYLLSRLRAGQPEYSSELIRRYPDFEATFLSRGFHVAMGYLGRRDLIDQYVRCLATKTGKTWDKQRSVNVDFHILYLGSMSGALAHLRETITTLSPRNLASLDVFTLGQMSQERSDIGLLEQHATAMESAGVPRSIISQAIEAIAARTQAKRR